MPLPQKLRAKWHWISRICDTTLAIDPAGHITRHVIINDIKCLQLILNIDSAYTIRFVLGRLVPIKRFKYGLRKKLIFRSWIWVSEMAVDQRLIHSTGRQDFYHNHQIVTASPKTHSMANLILRLWGWNPLSESENPFYYIHFKLQIEVECRTLLR